MSIDRSLILKKHACHFCPLKRVAKLCIFLEGRETAPLPSQLFAPPMKKTAAVSLWLKLLVGAYSWHMIQYLHLTYSIYHQIISHHISVYDMDYDIDIVLKLRIDFKQILISPTGRVSHCHRQSQRSQDMRKANGTVERFQTEGRRHRGIQFGKYTPK